MSYPTMHRSVNCLCALVMSNKAHVSRNTTKPLERWVESDDMHLNSGWTGTCMEL
jgi:hypothetical protein